MYTVEIDFDVLKEITARRDSEYVTPNDVLRKLFKLKPKQNKKDSYATVGKPWVAKGVFFPHDTEFSAVYKGQEFDAIVNDGALVLNGKRFSSPSSAAVSITGNPVNGWIFWKCKLPGQQTWQIIEKYRNQTRDEGNGICLGKSETIVKTEGKTTEITIVTDNDIKARILRIPKAIKLRIGKSKKITLYFDETTKETFNIDKKGNNICGVTDIFRKYGLVDENRCFSQKISSWKEFEEGFMVKFVDFEAIKNF